MDNFLNNWQRPSKFARRAKSQNLLSEICVYAMNLPTIEITIAISTNRRCQTIAHPTDTYLNHDDGRRDCPK
jgi:hypothetical protein